MLYLLLLFLDYLLEFTSCVYVCTHFGPTESESFLSRTFDYDVNYCQPKNTVNECQLKHFRITFFKYTTKLYTYYGFEPDGCGEHMESNGGLSLQ